MEELCDDDGDDFPFCDDDDGDDSMMSDERQSDDGDCGDDSDTYGIGDNEGGGVGGAGDGGVGNGGGGEVVAHGGVGDDEPVSSMFHYRKYENSARLCQTTDDHQYLGQLLDEVYSNMLGRKSEREPTTAINSLPNLDKRTQQARMKPVRSPSRRRRKR